MADIIPTGGDSNQCSLTGNFSNTYDNNLNSMTIMSAGRTCLMKWTWTTPRTLDSVKVAANNFNYTNNKIYTIWGIDSAGSATLLWSGTWKPPEYSSTGVFGIQDVTPMANCYGIQLGINSADANIELIEVRGYESDTYDLNLMISPSNSGTITADPPNSPGYSPGWYLPGTVVTLTETPADGYTFNNWGGDGSGCSGTTCQITMDGEKTVYAYFVAVGDPTCTCIWSPSSPVAGGSITATFSWTNARPSASIPAAILNIYNPSGTSCASASINTASGSKAITCSPTVAGQYHAKAMIMGNDNYYHQFDFYKDVAPGDGGGAKAVFECDTIHICEWLSGPFTPGQPAYLSGSIFIRNNGETGTIYIRFYYFDIAANVWQLLPNCYTAGSPNCDMTSWPAGALGQLVNTWVDLPANIPTDTILFGAKVWGDGESEPSFP